MIIFIDFSWFFMYFNQKNNSFLRNDAILLHHFNFIGGKLGL